MAGITRRSLFKWLAAGVIVAVLPRQLLNTSVNDEPVVLSSTTFVQEWPYLTDVQTYDMFEPPKLWVETRKGSHVWVNLLS